MGKHITVEAMPMSLSAYNESQGKPFKKDNEEGYLVINSLGKEMWMDKAGFDYLFKGIKS